MFRVLSILAAIVALAVSAAPASANDQWRKAPPKPPGLGVTDFKGELVGIEPSLRKASPKPRNLDVVRPLLVGGAGGAGSLATLPQKGRGAGKVANHTVGTIRGIFGGRYAEGQFGGR